MNEENEIRHIWAIGLAVSWFVAIGCGDTQSRCGPSKATVVRVVDGDTVELDTGQKVRYLLVDTPESTNGADDCYGHEAADYNSMLVLDREVGLTYDQECTDRYGRLLAYVEVDGIVVNMRLVQQGYACVLFFPPNGQDQKDAYEEAQFEAKSMGRGMWGDCEEVTCE